MRSAFSLRFLLLLLTLMQLSGYAQQHRLSTTNPNVVTLKSMFQHFTVEKNIKTATEYFSKNFVLVSNGKAMNYAQFYALHQRLFATPINYHIKYDAHNWVVSSQKVAARIFIDIQIPNAPVRQLEVFVIAHFNVDHRLTALYELTYPDWSHAVSQVSQS